MVQLAKRIVESPLFSRFIIGVIVAAGVLVGIQTFPSMEDRYGPFLNFLDAVILGIFTVEILIKMVALSPRPWDFFKSGWNIFDFIIVGGLLPALRRGIRGGAASHAPPPGAAPDHGHPAPAAHRGRPSSRACPRWSTSACFSSCSSTSMRCLA